MVEKEDWDLCTKIFGVCVFCFHSSYKVHRSQLIIFQKLIFILKTIESSMNTCMVVYLLHEYKAICLPNSDVSYSISNSPND